ncbi:thermonuclease family protein [Stieleria bergensis]|uniref:thermonuclease family protein n=1 Tax=Stieleria bergensis TaxID=2528025 RepID=UPI003AF3D0B5
MFIEEMQVFRRLSAKSVLVHVVFVLAIGFFSGLLRAQENSQLDLSGRSLTSEQKEERVEAKLLRVIDGDTIEVLSPEFAKTRIRINGIDAPERGQPFSNVSKTTLIGLLRLDTVQYEKTGTDRYGRVVAEIYVADERIALKLVQLGVAWHYKQYSKDKLLAAAEDKARTSKLAIWSDQNPVAPWDWRRRPKAERDRIGSGH